MMHTTPCSERQEPLRQDDANDRVAELADEDEDGGEGTVLDMPSGPPSDDDDSDLLALLDDDGTLSCSRECKKIERTSSSGGREEGSRAKGEGEKEIILERSGGHKAASS